MVIAVEPDPRCLPTLQVLAAVHDRLRIVPAALNRDGYRDIFYQADQSVQSSLDRKAVRDVIAEFPVDGVTLDTLTSRPVHAVKLDLQGGELDALRGGPTLMGRCHRWCVELWPSVLGPVKGELLLWMFQNMDFNVHWMDDGYPVADYKDVLAYLKTEHEPHEHVNVVFQRAGVA
jgi:FkbM family methyltransferase